MNSTITPRSVRAAAVFALVLGAPFALTACSDASSAPTSTGAAGGLGAQWGDCMRDAGFSVEDPTDAELRSGTYPAPADADADAFGERAAACSEQAGVERADASQKQEWERQYAQVADCIRENGFDDLPEQAAGVLDFQGYPGASEPEFDEVSAECLAEFAPDTQTLDR